MSSSIDLERASISEKVLWILSNENCPEEDRDDLSRLLSAKSDQADSIHEYLNARILRAMKTPGIAE